MVVSQGLSSQSAGVSAKLSLPEAPMLTVQEPEHPFQGSQSFNGTKRGKLWLEFNLDPMAPCANCQDMGDYMDYGQRKNLCLGDLITEIWQSLMGAGFTIANALVQGKEMSLTPCLQDFWMNHESTQQVSSTFVEAGTNATL